uniref:Uncharacterized protein n=1 Tax=Cyprinus carpio TaxID=7962 RepID=A0A8C2B3Y4_CYPCA
ICQTVLLLSAFRYLLVALGIIFIVRLTLCYTKAVVAADAGTCSEIGRDILKTHKGSVVDAAIATLLCLSLVNAQSMGIGGGVVFTIYNASTGTVETINARETAPMNASENMFGNGTEKKPGLFIAVPGELHGYKLAHERYGRLNWSELFQPSIKLARDGFKIGKALAKAIKENEKDILNNAALCEVFCKSNTIILKENDYISFPKLAHTYEKIANYGISAFYNGSLTQGIVDDIKAQGGIITREDLMNYKPVLNESALNFTVGKYIFLAPDAPFGGPVLALILNILKGYNLSSSSVSPIRNKTLTYHRIIEAFRFANEKKSKLGDPSDESIRELVKNMTSESTANRIRSKIKDDIRQVKYDDNEENYPDDDRGTSHLSIIGEDGSAVAVTSSINDYFGSKVRSNSTGIIFNDQMNDFCKPKQENECNKNNRIKPGKRPLSSMCPTIILDKHSGQVKMVVGGEGGTNITTSVAQVILNYLLFGYDLQKAIEEPRISNNYSNFLSVLLKNHTIFHNAEVAVVQAVVREGDKVCAESDYRKGGYPAGYPEPIL